jgi:hypothetical protein
LIARTVSSCASTTASTTLSGTCGSCL